MDIELNINVATLRAQASSNETARQGIETETC
jgi:hypothetical protein